jgi:hypothetical protein
MENKIFLKKKSKAVLNNQYFLSGASHWLLSHDNNAIRKSENHNYSPAHLSPLVLWRLLTVAY